VCQNVPSVSYLLFTNDYLILMKVNMVSEAKYSIYFSPNVDVYKLELMCVT
jgi:hypothetical protein